MIKEVIYPNLLDIGILLKHFPSLLNTPTDIGALKHLEMQARNLEKYPVYNGRGPLPMKLQLINERNVVLTKRMWNY